MKAAYISQIGDPDVIQVDGKLRANIATTLSLDQAAEAHRLQEDATLNQSGDLSGKIVLTLV